jgi:ppGpp synthetase/RelA/SpoT-type nucleotidyltranferase
MDYEKVKELATVAAGHLRAELRRAIRSLGDPVLARVTFEPFGIKSPESLRRKAAERGWGFDEAAKKVTDLVGARMVCHNLQYASRIADYLEHGLLNRRIEVRRQDYIARPKRGYRAIHLDVRIQSRWASTSACTTTSTASR